MFLIYRLIHGGQLLNGLAGPTIMSAGPLLSTTWFGPDQRATATAIASLIGYLGSAGAFLIGPLVVPAPNETHIASGTIHLDQNHIKDRIQFVLYSGALLSATNPQTLLFLINSKLFSTFAQPQKSNHSKAIHMPPLQIPQSNLLTSFAFTSQ